jgi:hypothetical protein
MTSSLRDESLKISCHQFLHQTRWIKPETRTIIAEIDAFLGRRSGNAHEDFWTMESLQDSPDWEQVRQLALKALLTL